MKGLRGFIRGGLTYTGAQFVAKAVLTLLTPLWAQILTTAQLGQLTIYGTAFSLVAIAANPALHGGLSRALVGEEDETRATRTISTAFWMLLGLAATVGGLLLLTAPWWFPRIGLDVVGYAWPLAFAGGILLSNLEVLPTAVWVARSQATRLALMTLVSSLAMVALVVAMLSVGGVPAWAPAVARQASTLIGLIAAVSIFARVRLVFDRPVAREMLLFSLPLAPHLLAHWSLALADRWIISRQLGLSALGIYGAAYFLTDALFVAQSSWNRAWVPWFTRVAEQNPNAAEIQQSSSAMYSPTIVLAALGAIAAPPLLAVAYPPEFAAATRVAPVLLVSAVPQSLYLTWVGVLFFRRSTRALPLATAGAAIVNVVATLALIPVLGLMGAAIATVIGYVVLAGAARLLAQREWRATVDQRHAFGLAGVAMAVGVGSAVLPTTPGSVADWLIRGCVLVAGLGVWWKLNAPAVRRLLRARD